MAAQAPAGRMGVFGFIYFATLNTGPEAIIFFAVIRSLVPHDMLSRLARRLRAPPLQ
jgi:hypothetical protein